MRKVLGLGLALVGVLALSGCSTVCRKQVNQINELKSQVSSLKSEIQYKDDQITQLRYSVSQAPSEKFVASQAAVSMGAAIPEVKSRPKAKQIQAALKNAGYYNGPVDGKIGKRTRKAIRNFQKDNGLQVDGKVGKDTWAKLKNAPEKKVSEQKVK
ncbi:MAG: peptidoglycan-binding protein [Candidatus Omnitrophica bacterium]|jgi:murein L,D-transpeptidase YcbB/YkuD|nr:peptidoglycan-binding protein [Candidatus Omnitrophota bacterium]